MKKLLLILACAAEAFANQSVNTNSSCVLGATCPVVALPNSAPFSTAGNSSQRWELRIHASSFSSGYVALLGPQEFYIGSGSCQLTPAINPPVADTIVQSSPLAACTSGTDYSVRVMRDVPNMQYTVQVCQTTTEVCQIATYAITILGTATNWNVFAVGFGSGFDIAWLRWFSTLTDPSNIILNTNTGDVLDWEFEGNLTDSVVGLSMSNPGVTYTTTPVYSPVCLPLAQQTFKTGVAGTVTGANLCQPLDGGATLTPTWSYNGTGADGVTQSLSFGSSGSITTTVSGYIKGSVNLKLHLVDGSANSSDTIVHDGAVTVDANDVVVTGLSAMQDHILGPLLRFGSPNNRVPWYDYTNKELADLQGGAQSTNFPTYWSSYAAGTVSVSPTQTCGGSGVGQGLVGTGTSFTTFSPNDYISIAWNSGANNQMNIIVSIPSDTCIIMLYAWPESTTESGLHYAHPSSTAVANWGFAQQGTPGNYYDNVKAFRSLYERSGIDTYWPYYMTLADNFFAAPPNDKGLSYTLATQSQFQFTSRSQSLEGLMIRAGDAGMSGMWSGIDEIIKNDTARLNRAVSDGWVNSSDTREVAYQTEFCALYYHYGPTAGVKAGCLAALSSAIPNLYNSDLFADGSIPTLLDTSMDLTNSVTVTNGSATVTCAGCNWTAGYHFIGGSTGSAFVTYSTFPSVPSSNTGFSAVYYPTLVDAHTLTLDRVYAGSSSVGSNTGWGYSANRMPGWGEQPFMAGIQTKALIETYEALTTADPTNSALAKSLAASVAGWLTTYGYSDPAHSGTGGAYYYQSYLLCSYPVQSAPCKLGFDASQSRTDAGEMVQGLWQVYTAAPTAGKLTFMQTLLDQMFCRPGYGAGVSCSYDGYYITDLNYNNNATFMTSSQPGNKWFGFFFGWTALTNPLTAATVSTPTGSVIRGMGLYGGLILH